MQLRLPFLDATVAPTLDAPAADRSVVPEPVQFVRTPRARRYVLRVRPDGTLRVTIPRHGSRAEALRFVEKHRSWIRRERLQVAATEDARRVTQGSMLLFRGTPVPVDVIETSSGAVVSYGDRRLVDRSQRQDRTAVVERDLRALAREELVPRLCELAAQHGLTVTRVTIRNQRSRWGSCSRAGAVALNYRLVQMPPEVSDYVLLHELMHLKQQNHSRRFWRLVQAACPRFREAERWLKTEGRALL